MYRLVLCRFNVWRRKSGRKEVLTKAKEDIEDSRNRPVSFKFYSWDLYFDTEPFFLLGMVYIVSFAGQVFLGTVNSDK